MPRVKCNDAGSYKQEMVTSSDNQTLQRTKKLSSHHKRRGNLQEDTSAPKPYTPDDKQNQAAKKRPYVDTYKEL